MKRNTHTSDSLRKLARCLLVTCLFFSVPGFSQAQQDLTSGKVAANASTTTHTGGEATRASNTAAAKEPQDDSFVIGSDDVLGINVWKEAEVSRTETVRSDGKISLPLLGELQAASKTPKQLQDEIHNKLAALLYTIQQHPYDTSGVSFPLHGRLWNKG
jgi:protein involved in polysaccharide export with SLBB domain